MSYRKRLMCSHFYFYFFFITLNYDSLCLKCLVYKIPNDDEYNGSHYFGSEHTYTHIYWVKLEMLLLTSYSSSFIISPYRDESYRFLFSLYLFLDFLFQKLYSFVFLNFNFSAAAKRPYEIQIYYNIE